MRIAGTFLLLGGLLLCISIIWAAVGFLIMGLGLICLLIAERRKKPSTAPPGLLSDALDRRREPPPLQIDKRAQPAELVEASSSRIELQRTPSSLPEPKQPRPPKPAIVSPKDQPARRRNEPDTIPYDLEKWRALIKSDADVSRSVEALQPFGKKYVDQLAIAYLAFEEKSYLPTIVKLVADAIKKDSGRDPTSAAAMDGDPIGFVKRYISVFEDHAALTFELFVYDEIKIKVGHTNRLQFRCIHKSTIERSVPRVKRVLLVQSFSRVAFRH